MLAFTGVAACAGDVYVVCHPSLKLTEAEVRDLFLGEKQFHQGVRLLPVDNAALQPDFLDKALNISVADYVGMWAKRSFRQGLKAPALRASDREVLASISANPATVGYVSKPTSDVIFVLAFVGVAEGETTPSRK